ncbi:ferritin [Candidatus Micrarchaeota archaeon]|nr:ferritin [Candidatus Micrarchaeota archaeon]MBD3418108.1 ferritin [Candidatus Micrarchaeota archaeon]
MGKYQLFVCKICGDPYLGTDAPSRCPFCGAYEENIVPAEEWEPLWGKPIGEKSRKHLEAALQIEVSNTNFYRNASEASKDVWAQKEFKALMKIEAEHAETIVKLLGAEMPDFKELELEEDRARESIEANLAESHRRETRAINAYKMAMEDSEDEHVKYLFGELIKIESDHLSLSE